MEAASSKLPALVQTGTAVRALAALLLPSSFLRFQGTGAGGKQPACKQCRTDCRLAYAKCASRRSLRRVFLLLLDFRSLAPGCRCSTTAATDQKSKKKKKNLS